MPRPESEDPAVLLKAARAEIASDVGSMKSHLIFVSGYALGGKLYGSFAAIERAFKELFPADDFPKVE